MHEVIYGVGVVALILCAFSVVAWALWATNKLWTIENEDNYRDKQIEYLQTQVRKLEGKE